MTERRKQGKSTAVIAILLLLLYALYANLRWANVAPVFEKAKQTSDTSAYVRVAGEELFIRSFWANTRPPMFPLVLKAYRVDFVKVAAFQTAFSIFAWGTLALSLAHSLKFILRPIAFALILAISLERHVASWDVVMLTESISISLMALLLAVWLWLLKKWSWGKVFLLCLVALVWAFTRDTNGWILLMIAGLIFSATVFFGARWRYLLVAGLLAVAFLISNLSANSGNRWVFPFQNVLAQRILTDQEALSFFTDCGMPVTPKLLKLAGGYANSEDRAFYTDPALQAYRNWLHDDGKSCYMRWLLSSPLKSLREPWPDFGRLLVFGDVSFFFPQRYEPVLPWFAERILYPQGGVLGLWALSTVGALAAIWKKAWKVNPAWLVFIGLCLLIYPHLFIVWHGDVPGTHRHALTVSLQFVLSFWLLGLLLAERIFVYIRARVAR